jgi:DNA repair protein RadC
MKKMHDIEEHDRPREKIRKKGASCLSNQELIAAILGSGSPGRNVRVLAKEISDIIDKNPDAVQYQDFALVKGMGSAKTSQIIACLELARRFYSGDTTTPKISTPADILPHVSFLSGKKQEHFICITLNGILPEPSIQAARMLRSRASWLMPEPLWGSVSSIMLSSPIPGGFQ